MQEPSRRLQALDTGHLVNAGPPLLNCLLLPLPVDMMKIEWVLHLSPHVHVCMHIIYSPNCRKAVLAIHCSCPYSGLRNPTVDPPKTMTSVSSGPTLHASILWHHLGRGRLFALKTAMDSWMIRCKGMSTQLHACTHRLLLTHSDYSYLQVTSP